MDKYRVGQEDGEWMFFNYDTGEIVGFYSSRTAAVEAMRLQAMDDERRES